MARGKNEQCGACHVTFSRGQNCEQCDFCELWFHSTCKGVGNDEFIALESFKNLSFICSC